ncbi:MAG: molybdate ABC transporter substrate-binding protein [Sporichthyaceae bacterium]
MSPIRLRRRTISVAFALAVLGGCAESDGPAAHTPVEQGAASAPAGSVAGDLTVLAAASLSEVFTRLGERFEAKHPGLSIVFSFGASSALAQQIVAKAPADVFAAASPATMAIVTNAGGAAANPTVFVKNTLQIATPKDNPGNVQGLSDFARSELKIVVCAVAIPCGAASDGVFSAAGVQEAIDSYEQDVKGVLNKVATGEADAGLVYRTDVLAAGDRVTGIDFVESAGAVNDYPVVALDEAKNPAAAAAWVAFLTGDEAKAAFAEAGFQVP